MTQIPSKLLLFEIIPFMRLHELMWLRPVSKPLLEAVLSECAKRENVDEIKSDPVQYAIDNDFYDSCSCSNKEVGFVDYNNKMVIQNWTG